MRIELFLHGIKNYGSDKLIKMLFSEENKESNDSLDLTPLEDLLNYQHENETIKEEAPQTLQQIKDTWPDLHGEDTIKPEYQLPHKIQERREREIVSKEYVGVLESKIKALEEENSRLQNIVINLNTEKYSKVDPNSKAFLQDIQELKNKTVERFFNVDTMEHKSNPSISLGK